jgi:hypothetical protein
MIENDPNKLLNIFLELDLAMEEEQRGAAPVDLRDGGNRRIERSARLM